MFKPSRSENSPSVNRCKARLKDRFLAAGRSEAPKIPPDNPQYFAPAEADAPSDPVGGPLTLASAADAHWAVPVSMKLQTSRFSRSTRQRPWDLGPRRLVLAVIVGGVVPRVDLVIPPHL